MSKVITFSRKFPAYHPNKGGPTYFVEKVWEAIEPGENEDDKIIALSKYQDQTELNNEMYRYLRYDFVKKIHTIRNGGRWKTGDKASLRVWSGQPYHSKQVEIAPEITIPLVLDFELTEMRDVFIDGKKWTDMDVLAKNDGLKTDDLSDWFNKPFRGQIIFLTNVDNPYECR
ncbi:MAG: hypothetical protein EOP56_09275 [Sphingobacteriales bacterium]|nr:MAG: hypothetical protein EOP56_09275 [Sphingobacteriales bacterium]